MKFIAAKFENAVAAVSALALSAAVMAFSIVPAETAGNYAAFVA